MDLERYICKKNLLKQNLQQLYVIADELELKNRTDLIKRSIEFLDNEKFELVVVGEFSRGKSTFINAMLGKKILPAKKRATTAIISKIIYSDKPKYYLHYKNNKKQIDEISEEFFLKLIAPRENTAKEEKKHMQDFLNQIDFADIAYPLDICRDNVEIVDTPGINDVNQNRIEITYRYLNQADAVIMLLSSTQALSRSEVDFLKERILGNRIQNIFFVISHKDEISSQSEKKVYDFVVKNLKEILPNDIILDNRVFLVSSLQTLAYRMTQNGIELTSKTLKNNMVPSLDNTGFLEFERDLAYFLANDKGDVKLDKYINQGKIAIEDLKKMITLQKGLVLHLVDELRLKINKMEPEFDRAKYNVTQIIKNMQIKLKNSFNDIESKAILLEEKTCQVANTAVENYEGSFTDTNKLMSVVNKAVTEEQRKFINELQLLEDNYLNKVINETQKKLQKILDDIDIEYQQNFNLPVVINKNNEVDISDVITNMVAEKDKKEIIMAYGIGGGIGLVLGGAALLPIIAALGVGAWFLGFFEDKDLKMKNVIKNKLTDHYNGLGKKIANDINKQYMNRIEEICQFIEKVANYHIDDMERQLNNMIKEKESKEQDIKIEFQRLESKENILIEINRKLDSLKH